MAVEAGIDCIEHGDMIDFEIAELLAQHDVTLVPTLGEILLIPGRGPEYGKPQWLIDKCEEDIEKKLRSFRCAFDAGVRIAVGTDTIDSVSDEIQLMVEQGGASPMDAIVSATRNGAVACNLLDRTGTLEPGKWADIVILEGNPIEDVSAFFRIRYVMKTGIVYEPAKLSPAVGRYPL